MISPNPSPAALGYRMPAEWEPHEATWIAWPHERSDWPGKFAPIPWVYAECVRYLSRAEKVRILVKNELAEQAARRVLEKSGVRMEAVEFLRCPTNRSWTRDYGPLFVRNHLGQVAITHWRFNGWARYGDYLMDGAVPALLRRRLRMPYFQPRVGRRRVVLEGGAIDVNGRGALLATEECLLSPIQARNPGLSRQELESVLGDYLGVRQVLWLKRGIEGDDTHGHIDDIARFVSEATVVAASERDRNDANFAPLNENLRLLRRMTDESGRKLEVVKLPMPRPRYFGRQRLPASYANFYIANGMVLVPVFNDPADREALNIMASLFRDREVVPIYSGDLVLGLGALHCMTQQQPAAGT